MMVFGPLLLFYQYKVNKAPTRGFYMDFTDWLDEIVVSPKSLITPKYGGFNLKNLKCFISYDNFINPYFSCDILFTDLSRDPFFTDCILKFS